jgi:hypothetical protein
MTDDDEIDEDDDCTYDSTGECDDPYCGHRSVYYVEEQRTVRYAINAHNDDEALQIMWNQNIITVDEPASLDGVIDDFQDDGEDTSIESEAERRAYQARMRAIEEQVQREMAAEEAAAQ